MPELTAGGIAPAPTRVPRLGPLRTAPAWSDAMAAASGLRVEPAAFVTVGGGLASFAVVDGLRIRGLPTADIRVVSMMSRPYENLRQLIRAGQIQGDDPLRSDSASRVDNPWGFPGYAVEEAIRRRSLRPLWKVLAEPVAAEFYNPSPDQVFRGLDREAGRIGWDSMLVTGRAELIRRRIEGGYFCLVHPVGHSSPYLLRSRYVHLATGYPALGYTSELTEYRLRYGEFFNVVNAYEQHEHVYQVLRRRGGIVLVRGAGITASRVLQRLIDDRDRTAQDVQILHLFRDHAGQPSAGWRYQAFSFPKSASSGQLREELASLSGAERTARIAELGATSTAKRRGWQRQLRRAQSEGFYHAISGEITAIEPSPDRRVRLVIAGSGDDGLVHRCVDFVLDCTGMSLRLRDNPLLADLVDRGYAAVNVLGGLDVGPHFEVRGQEETAGRLYASGVIAHGGYLAPADSFLGAVHAALLICDDLAAQGACARLGPVRSVAGWVRWLTGRAP